MKNVLIVSSSLPYIIRPKGQPGAEMSFKGYVKNLKRGLRKEEILWSSSG